MQNYPILLITTENYVPFAACLMTSIIYNTNKIVGGGGGESPGQLNKRPPHRTGRKGGWQGGG